MLGTIVLGLLAPDLSGIWKVDSAQPNENLLPNGEVPMQPWAAELYRHRVATMGFERPGTRCMPHGAPDAVTVPNLPFKIVQTPSELIVLNEREVTYRQIFTDGRPLPEDPQPTWKGYSVGHWEGDTLVVTSNGFRDGIWLDRKGSPLSEGATMVERITRPTYGQMRVQITITDLKAYTAPFTVTLNEFIVLDKELIDFVCLENNKDEAHLVGM